MKKNFFIGLFVSCMVIVGCTGGGDSYSSNTNNYKDFSSGNEDSLGFSSSTSESSTSDSPASSPGLSNSS